MALLLTEPYDPVKQTRWVGDLIQQSNQLRQRQEELAAQERQKQQAMMQAELADTRRAIEIQQRQEYERAADARKEEQNAFLNEPFVDRSGGVPSSATIASSVDPQVAPPSSALIASSASPGFSMEASAAPGIGGGEPLGKVTDYGQKDDAYGDSASLGQGNYAVPTGAWDNPLSPSSLAVSPDIEEKFKAAGIAPRSPVQLKLADGTTVVRTWDDRTMQDADAAKKFGAPLRGRFDFFNPGGASSMRDKAVVGFSPVGGRAGGAAPIDGELPTGGGAAAVSNALLPQESAASPARSIAAELAKQKIPNRFAMPALVSAISRTATDATKPAKGQIQYNADGTFNLGNTLYRYDDKGEAVKVAAEPKPAAGAAPMLGEAWKTADEAVTAAEAAEKKSGNPTTFYQSPKTGLYTLKQVSAKQNDEVKAKAKEQMGLFKTQISDAKNSLNTVNREIAAFEKPDPKNPTGVFSSTTGIFTDPAGKKRFGQANVEAEKSVEATDQLETSYQRYLALKSQAKELQAKMETAQQKRDAFEELADSGVKGETYRKSLEVAEGGAPAPAAGDPNEKVAVLSPEGRPGRIPRSQLAEALKAGYTQP